MNYKTNGIKQTRKYGRIYKRNMRGGRNRVDSDEESSFSLDKETKIMLGIGLVIATILLTLGFTGVIHARSSSSSGKSL